MTKKLMNENVIDEIIMECGNDWIYPISKKIVDLSYNENFNGISSIEFYSVEEVYEKESNKFEVTVNVSCDEENMIYTEDGLWPNDTLLPARMLFEVEVCGEEVTPVYYKTPNGDIDLGRSFYELSEEPRHSYLYEFEQK